MAANRILVDRALEPAFSARFTERVAALRTGDPADPATQLGPVIDSFHAEALTALVDEALAEGATPLLHGRTVGNLVEPTILTGLSPHSPLLRQEIFGPVALLVPFDGDEEGLRLTNDTPYGLSSAVHTGDAERGVAFARRVEAGMIHVNGTTMEDDPMAAFGGVEALRDRAAQRGRFGGRVHDAAVDLRAARARDVRAVSGRAAGGRGGGRRRLR
ncbi:aldehyde dehydrogenase (NAD+) [Streptomyces sp. SolWspMP-sol7th]|nr:aldehyde dehydrogenase (NAD+) [Streptomyces sp. SolWspMP-sol7th]